MEEDRQRFLLFFAVSMVIMVGYPYFFGGHPEQPTAPATQVVQMDQQTPETAANPAVVPPPPRRSPALPQNKIECIRLESAGLSGVISSAGAKIEDVRLKKYRKNLGNAENVQVFANRGGRYFGHTRWTTDDPHLTLPDENSRWKADSTKLSEGSPVTLAWDNGDGLLFEKRISVDENYLITIQDRVKNYGNRTVRLRLAAMVNREFEKKSEDSFSFYEGPIGYLDGKLEEVSYEDVAKKSRIEYSTRGGWFGITDKYWLVAFIPDQNLQQSVSYRHASDGGRGTYSVESLDEAISLAPSQEISRVNHLFTGAKEIKTLDMYEGKLRVKHFDMAIDFGCLYILTKPLLYTLAYTKDLVGNMGLGIILITLLIKLLLLPLANKSYRSMNRMKEIQPKIQALQKRYADDKAKLGQEISAIYKKEAISPLGGCLPTLLQSPVLFALYKVLYVSIEMRQAPFVGWIHDLSLPDPLLIFNLFGLIPIDLPGFLQVGIWPLLMGLTMFLQQKMSPSPPDQSQANVMLLMPLMFTFMFAQLPSGLVIYWTFSNALGIMQQYAMMRADARSGRKKS
ncbi:MAG: membrane protein insertase YidC [Holosporaceae bacterium]|jgi:YidC/Oxa1 family membrane protein insertase|nr:membrane protein insertase YidC [Holosporaceae bacterium]